MLAGTIREVTCTTDGCTVYECLSCYGRIETRNSVHDGENLVWKFCAFCGEPFTRYMPVDQEKEERDYDIRWEVWNNQKRRKTRSWLIEWRMIWPTKPHPLHPVSRPHEEWKTHATYPLDDRSAHDLHREVQRLQKSAHSCIRYRVRVIDKPMKK